MIVEIKVPSPGESITEVEIANWIVSDGDYVKKDQEICEIDSDKATLTLVAEESGKIKILVKPETTINVGDVVCKIDTAITGISKANKSKKNSGLKNLIAKQDATKNQPNFSIAAKKITTENNLSIISGTGKGDRITKQDVLNRLKKRAKGPRKIEEKKLSTLRRKIAQRLVSVKNETAMLTTFNEIDMSAVMNLRKKHKTLFEKKHNIKLGFMSFFTKAVVKALKEYSNVNAMVNNNHILYHSYCDIGIAVSAQKGLMVPVLRNAELMSFSEIETEIKKLSTKVRDGKITLEEMSHGTFTITNGGVFGSMLSTPIINPPQSAILGMHNILERPIVFNNKIEIRPIMYVALSYDHRIIDGKDSVGFLIAIKNCLENPVDELMNGSIKKGLQL